MADYNNSDVYNRIAPAYQGWPMGAAMHDFYDSRGGDFGKLPGPYGDQLRQASGANTSNFDPVAQAQKLRDFTVQSNQPAINQLQGFIPQVQSAYASAGSAIQGGIAPLEQRYQGLIDQIKGLGEQNINQSTQAITTNLGARGLMPNSGVGQTELAAGLNPIRTQIQGQLGQAVGGEQADINSIYQTLAGLQTSQAGALAPVNQAIAQLQAGNPESAISGAISQQGILQSAQNVQSQLANQLKIAQLENQYRQIGYGGKLYNTATGSTVGAGGNTPLSTNNNFTPSNSPIPTQSTNNSAAKLPTNAVEEALTFSQKGQPSPYQYNVPQASNNSIFGDLTNFLGGIFNSGGSTPQNQTGQLGNFSLTGY